MIGIKTKKGSTPKVGGKVEKPEDKKTEVRNFPEVESFLGGIGMQKYLQTFIKNGFEDLETILELRDADFTAMGIPLGHKLKMLKKIKELKPAEPKPAPAPQPKLHGIQKNVEPKKEYAELPVGDEEKGETKKENKKSVHFGESAVIIEIARESETLPYENNKENLMKLNNEPKPKAKEKADTETKTSPKNSGAQNIVFLRRNEEKESCWNCYKLFIKGQGYTDDLTEKVLFSGYDNQL
eukprot:TRINITY_DN289_c0_g1_i1.p6 TRINITY_DN289_c0_g1~~TRINITY_DN289_c0_g1_i1.p6  ORF type:complete len:239 (-),score=54.86 TRINITY_DN289_c0_g1_i1:8086-8802(-)